jgi:DNA polymerase I
MSTVTKKCKNNFKSPAGHTFCKKPEGIIPHVLKQLIITRANIKKQLKKHEQSSTEYTKLFSRSQALKILANSFYGYMGYPRARWYSRECAESVTAWGRHYIKKTIKTAEDMGFTVIYSDTDSVLLLLGDKKLSDAKKFLKKVNSELPEMMELEFENFYPRGIFVSKKSGAKTGAKGAKKKYALIDEHGYIKIRGFELVRRDWSPIARQTQKKVLEIILIEGNKTKAVKLVKKVITDLKKYEIPLEKTAIRTIIRKKPDHYNLISPEVSAALKAIKKGDDIKPGTMVEYVITKGSGSISDRAVLLKYANNYDPQYYIKNQVLPAVLKILKELGITEDELTGKGRQESLFGFFK